MQLSSLNLISPCLQNKQGLSRQKYCRNADSFVKSTPDLSENKISFGRIKWEPDQIDAAVDRFSDGIIELVKNKQFNRDNVQGLVNKVAPDSDITVHDFDKLKDSTTSPYAYAFCTTRYTDPEGADLRSFIGIKFNELNLNNINSIASTINITVHEFRHALGNSVGESKNILEHFAKKISDKTKAQKIQNNFEYSIGIALNMQNISNKPIKEVNDKELLEKTGCKSIKEMESRIHNCIDKHIYDLNPNDRKEMYKYLSNIFRFEALAQKAGQNAIKKCLGIKTPVDLDLLPYFTSKLANYFDSLYQKEPIFPSHPLISKIISPINNFFKVIQNFLDKIKTPANRLTGEHTI